MSHSELLILKQRLLAAVAGGPAAFSVERARQYWYPDADSFVFPQELIVDHDSAGGREREWIRRRGASDTRVILYFHGGGFVCGSIASHRPITCELARSFDGAVVSLDYRLAPEHPYPAAVDDTVAAYESLLARGLSSDAIALAGDSAGGGLVLATLLALRDRNRPLPAAGLCLSPWFDLARTGASIFDNASRDYMVAASALEASGTLYRGNLAPTDPRVSPLYADLSGLPPLLIQVGSGEILLDDSIRFARAAALADVKVTLEIWPQLQHVWHLFATELGEARDASARAARWLDELLRP